ncbi:DNA alkylation repair protein [Candidatus Saccharibacteria bacterium]|nr:DNA alkylation repair protein [Candidatus Saccharibacteria bacterium]
MDEIRKQLVKLSRGNQKFAEFAKKIIKTEKTIMGVRTPDFRKLMKGLSRKVSSSVEIENLFSQIDKNVYEEISVVGTLIVGSKLSDDEKIKLIKKYLKLVDNWAQIDGMVTRNMNSDLWWEFASECLKSDEEFVVRFGVICLMNNFLIDEKVDEVFSKLCDVKHDGYYIKMGIAWAYATAAVKYYEKTLSAVTNLETWTQRKALTKMLESYRFTPEQKTKIRELRARIKL